MYTEVKIKTVPIIDINGNQVKEIQLPSIFGYYVRNDLIRRAFLSSFTKSLQPKGRDPMAGRRTTAHSFGINLGMARVPRINVSGEGALAPNTVGGRLAFPPSTKKIIAEEINIKEKRLAIISAISAGSYTEFVKKRGHKIQEKLVLPVIISDEVCNLKKTKDVVSFLEKIGLSEELQRVKENRKIRPGKGKMRGRRYKRAVGPLFVVHNMNLPIVNAIRNIEGADVVAANNLSINHLAPGGHPGRLTIYT
ncbi:50S ribosomal protein L4, partial [Acidianus sp. RZ1]